MSKIRSYIRHPERFTLKEQLFFIKRLSFLISAGVPLVESIAMLAEQMQGKRHTAVIQKVLVDVRAGQALSKSFAKFPHIFSDFSTYIVEVGESSGTLGQNLAYLADELQKRQALRSKVVSACIYPALITFATVGIALFLTVYLFPKIMPVFNSLHVALPLPTRVMIALSGFVIHFGLLVLVLLILGVAGVWIALAQSATVQYRLDRMLLRVPLIGSMIRFYNLANACRTLGLLLMSGLRLEEALRVTAQTTKNLVYKKAFRDLARSITRGEKVSQYLLLHEALFPDVTGHLVAVGERSGTLPQTLVYLSSMFDVEVDEFTKNIATLIEPVLMISMGVIVGFIAVSIITPIYGLTQNLHA